MIAHRQDLPGLDDVFDSDSPLVVNDDFITVESGACVGPERIVSVRKGVP